MALFTGGHCLITGVPGLAKTLLIKTVAQILDLSFKRIQFTPDLMPADITGTEVLDEDGGHRSLRFVQRADLRADHPRRRDQPHAAQDAGGAARGDAGVPRHGRGPHLSARAAVLRARDAEPDRARRHLSAARGAARSLHVQHRDDLPRRRRRGPRRHAHDGRGDAAAGAGAERRRHPRDPAARAAGHRRRGDRALRRAAGRRVAARPPERPRVRARLGEVGRRPARVAGADPRRQGARAAFTAATTCRSRDIQALARPVLRHRIIPNFYAESERVTPDTSSSGSSRRCRCRAAGCS